MKHKKKRKGLGNNKLNKWLSAIILIVLAATGSIVWDDKRAWRSSPVLTTSTESPNSAVDGLYKLHGKVSHVGDGDTINLYVNGKRQRIRLANIDAPETGDQFDRPGQPYAKKSRDILSSMVLNKTLTLNCFEKDQYDRHVCNIPWSDGKTVNEQMVAKGWAWAYTGSKGRYLRDDNLKKVQAKARQKGLGLWQDKNPIAPWTWRYDCWQNKQCD